MEYKAELIVDSKATLGEGPSWDRNQKILYWVDILGKRIHIYDYVSKKNRFIEVNQYVGTAVPRKSGGLVLALQNGFYSLNPQTDQLTLMANTEEHLPQNRFNDGKCDAAGRFWAGTMGLDDAYGVGSLYCLDTENNVKTVLQNVTCSNGLAWSPDNRTMYYIDTPTSQIVAFDFNIEDGSICNERVVVEIPREMGFPDGMTIDEEGMLWVAHWQGFRIGRWNPFTGKLIQAIPIPAPLVTSCSFGGENMDELFITTARIGLSEETLLQYPQSGGVFKIKTDVKGMGMYPFLG
ncbi:SMP-30/gluconolactonase/LRE family protein [Neobacillus jeddahensis]|uniref:SMP-30/gluconolactonase/LRE family protein n=1 Tax=Neobacillus jeddahensis TaxID=1461580 RepID=UPI000A81BF0B|nr:SMP-30/gluconolactonase/LRE family protein [Neobacillus jeddahensis]